MDPNGAIKLFNPLGILVTQVFALVACVYRLVFLLEPTHRLFGDSVRSFVSFVCGLVQSQRWCLVPVALVLVGGAVNVFAVNALRCPININSTT